MVEKAFWAIENHVKPKNSVVMETAKGFDADEQIRGALLRVKKCNAEAENIKTEAVYAVLLDLPTSNVIAMATDMTQNAHTVNMHEETHVTSREVTLFQSCSSYTGKIA